MTPEAEANFETLVEWLTVNDSYRMKYLVGDAKDVLEKDASFLNEVTIATLEAFVAIGETYLPDETEQP